MQRTRPPHNEETALGPVEMMAAVLAVGTGLAGLFLMLDFDLYGAISEFLSALFGLSVPPEVFAREEPRCLPLALSGGCV